MVVNLVVLKLHLCVDRVTGISPELKKTPHLCDDPESG